ncbi:MAG: thiamine pyrophosphate-dependent enzyme [Planctomycetota bacterium]|jgi:2-oxoglutarate ferredoxin oxidoreductase subunit beta
MSMFGLKSDWSLDLPHRYFTMDSYEKGPVRWCPGCGDYAVLTAVQRICRDEQIPPEQTVCVSGIGCSSRFPHYMRTYGFHGLHGRALPVACGVKSRRPDLKVWVATGDGDCCSIGAGHWVHAVRYNMDMVVLLFDNGIYGLTKKQTSPTSPLGLATNTHPGGSFLQPLNVLSTTLGLSNCSFLAQTVDWHPGHIHATLDAAFKHRGMSFVRIIQRCPAMVPDLHTEDQQNPAKIALLTHEHGIQLQPAIAKVFENQLEHDPADLTAARQVAELEGQIPIGLIYRNESCQVYGDYSCQGLDTPISDKLAAIEHEFDRFAV